MGQDDRGSEAIHSDGVVASDVSWASDRSDGIRGEPLRGLVEGQARPEATADLGGRSLIG